MSGPIVRTGATPEFWSNWDRIFGEGAGTKKKTAKKKAVAKKSAKIPKKAAGKKTAKKKATRKKGR